MTLVRTVLSRQANVLRTPATIQAALAETPRDDAPIPRGLRNRSHTVESTLNGFRVTTLTPHRGASGTELIYLHGGAYVNPLVRAHWSIIGAIMKRTGATVTVPSYGLAPRHTAADAYPLLETIYSDVLQRAQGADVYLAGDSAGGGLALGLSIALRDKGTPPPAGVFLFSPWLDASMSNASASALVPQDVMLDVPGLAWCGMQWAGSTDVRDPRISPLYGDLSGLPPTYIYQGGHDIFLADVMKFADKAAATGMQLDLQVSIDGFHVFVGAPGLPESRTVFRHVAHVMGLRPS